MFLTFKVAGWNNFFFLSKYKFLFLNELVCIFFKKKSCSRSYRRFKLIAIRPTDSILTPILQKRGTILYKRPRKKDCPVDNFCSKFWAQDILYVVESLEMYPTV